jgi:hypothetical protein
LVFLRPNIEQMGEVVARVARHDALMRATVIYAICLHEIGHALGLADTADRLDIMWGGGKDSLTRYQRYHLRLQNRNSISTVSWLSEGDVARIKERYREPR